MFQRLYKNEAEWEEIDETEVRRRLAKHYTNVDGVVHEPKAGFTISTPFTLYRWREDE